MRPGRPPRVGKVVLLIFAILSAAKTLSADDLTPTDDGSPTHDDVRAAITRSLPFIEAKGAAWIEQRGCVSCHRVGMMTWSLTEAARHGFDVDPDKLAEWIDWTLTASLARDEEDGTIAGAKNLDGVAQELLGRKHNAPSPDRDESYTALVALLVAGQADDGGWAPGGQLPGQKRPLAETAEVSTMWNALALASLRQPSETTRSVVERAAQRLRQGTAAKSTEWYAVRLLFATKTGEPDRDQSWQQPLRLFQHDDGGWGWITAEPSDALATGLALFALCQSGVATSDPAVQSARRFLIETQTDDGSWPVHGTKEMKKEQIEETATYWGTAWATLGLLQTLPNSQ